MPRRKTMAVCTRNLLLCPRLTRAFSTALASRLHRVAPVRGKCYVLTFSRSHNLTLADMSPAEILPVIHTWTRIYTAHLSPSSPIAKVAGPTTRLPSGPHDDIVKPTHQLRYMQIFENKGAAMGCSNPHPHGQVWTVEGLPEEPAAELENLQKYLRKHGSHMLEDYVKLESTQRERTVFENEGFWAGCPWWAVWPFEVMIIAKAHRRGLPDLSEKEQGELAEALAEVTRRYDNLFETQFPYSESPSAEAGSSRDQRANALPGMGLHQAPLEGTDEEIEASHFHIHFYPPLLRSSTVRKFLVGYELMAEPQRDITPEQAAARLRDCGGELYRRKL